MGKAMTEGIRTSTFPGTPRSRSFTIPQSKIKDFCQLPLHKGAVGCSRTSAFFNGIRKNRGTAALPTKPLLRNHRIFRLYF